MRKYILATLFFIAFVLCLEPAEKLLSKYIFVEKPQYHQIAEGEWLSKIAIKYYGDQSYWQELELINRAPNGDKIYPGETIIIPSYEIMQKIRRTKRLSVVNDFIRNQEDIIAQANHEVVPEFETAEVKKVQLTEPIQEQDIEATEVSEPMEEEIETVTSFKDENLSASINSEDYEVEESEMESSPTVNKALFAGVIALCAAFITGIVFYIRNKKKEDVEYYGEVKEVEDVGEVEEEDFDEYKDEDEINAQPLRNRMFFEPREKESSEGYNNVKTNEKEFVS